MITVCALSNAGRVSQIPHSHSFVPQGCIALGWFVLWKFILSDIGLVRELLGVDKKVKKKRTQSAARRRRTRAAAAAAEADAAKKAD